MRSPRRVVLALCSTLAALSCGKDASGPGGPLTGSWHYTFSNLSGGVVGSCNSVMVMPLTQNGTDFTGTYAGSINCGGGNNFVNGAIFNGRTNAAGDTVRFYFDTIDWYNVGRIHGGGDSISGLINAHIMIGVQPVTLVGTFVAVRD